MPNIEFHHLTTGDTWIQPSGKSFAQCCCACGSTHNFELTVLNEEEIKVQIYRNDHFTERTRKEDKYECIPVSGTLVLIDLCLRLSTAVLDKDKKAAKNLAKQIRKVQKEVDNAEVG